MLHCLSINVNSLRGKQKYNTFFSNTQPDILLLQETKWDLDTIKNISQLWRGKIIAENGTQKACGVAIMFKEGKVDDINVVYKNGNGRIVIVDCAYNGEKLRLINLYASNCETERKEMFAKIGKWCNEYTIIVGDFNVALTKEDVSKNNVMKNDVSREQLFKLMKICNLTDVWRLGHKSKKQFSRKQVVKGTLKQTRIDLCLTAMKWTTKIRKIDYIENAWSDHAGLSFLLESNVKMRNGGTWCFNTSLVEDNVF